MAKDVILSFPYLLDLGRENGYLLLEVGELTSVADRMLIKRPLHVI